jgi:branched-chain amino acid transport system permease protein
VARLAFLGVILGGLGKVENTLAAGLIVGLIQTVCMALLPFDYVYLVLYLLLAAILILRREGLSAPRAAPCRCSRSF